MATSQQGLKLKIMSGGRLATAQQGFKLRLHLEDNEQLHIVGIEGLDYVWRTTILEGLDYVWRTTILEGLDYVWRTTILGGLDYVWRTTILEGLDYVWMTMSHGIVGIEGSEYVWRMTDLKIRLKVEIPSRGPNQQRLGKTQG